MRTTLRTRARVLATFVVTMLVIAGEFGFIMALYHSDDGVEARSAADQRVVGTLSAWQPGHPTTPVQDAVRRLAHLDRPGARVLVDATRGWASAPDRAGLTRVAAANQDVRTALDAAQRSADRRAAAIVLVVLLLVSTGWFVWFRQLVTRHRRLQQALTEKLTVDAGERRLMALVRNSVDLVAVLEADTTTSFVSPSAQSVLGRPAEALLGQPLVDLVNPDDVPVLARVLAGGREGEQAVTLRMRHADGRELRLEGTVTDLTDDEAVTGWVLTVRDVTDRDALQAELSHRAFHDTLTGLPNRQLFSDRLSHALRRRGGEASPAVVLFLDLDDFKHANDRFGHGTGDRLLVTVTERIRATVREGDTAARLGGDEFAVLMEGADLEDATQVAQRLLDTLSEPVSLDGAAYSVRASIGICAAQPGLANAEETLRNADVALYWAKGRGKATSAVYEPGQHAFELDQLTLRTELQRAIREDQLVLHFQPTVDLATNRIGGFEALVRWDHPTRGLLPPGAFIPIAERGGLIVPLGSWVLREACRAARQLEEHGAGPSIAVNVAADQLALDTFADEVVEVLQATGLAPSRLVLEITEGVVLGDMDGSVAQLARLRGLGVRVAIDDFGTGYSSLSYLARLPVDILKIDKSFVDHIAGRNLDSSLVEAIIVMSEGMGLLTVAEGIERREQADWLALNRCTLGQGFLWSRPVELAAARAMLRPDRSVVPQHGPQPVKD